LPIFGGVTETKGQQARGIRFRTRLLIGNVAHVLVIAMIQVDRDAPRRKFAREAAQNVLGS